MPVPYEPKPLAALSVNGGARGVFAWEIPSRSIVHCLRVVQTAGAADPFTVSLYTAEPAANNITQPGPLPPDLFLVAPPLNSSAGKVLYFSDIHGQGFGFPFFSHDAHRLGNRRTIWLVIQPQGSGVKEFAATIGVMTLE